MFARLVLAFTLAAALLTHPNSTSWNENSRLAAVESLVDRGTFAIDDSPYRTGDKYRYKGRYYSDKPPFFTLLGAIVGGVLKIAHIGLVQRSAKVFKITLSVSLVALPFGLGVGGIFILLRLLETEESWAVGIATIAGTATLALPFASVLINHIPAAALLVGGLVCLVEARIAAAGGLVVALAGALLAFAIGIDTSYAIFFVLAPIAIGRANFRPYAAYLGGALPSLVALGYADLALSGTWLPPDTNAALFDWPGSEFVRGNIAGGIVHRSFGELIAYAFNLLVGTRGLYLYSPILILGTYALVRRLTLSKEYDPHRSIYVFIAVASVLYVASAIVATIDYGGSNYGTRTFVGVSWLLCIPLATLAPELGASGTRRTLFMSVVLLSLGIALLGSFDPFTTQPFPLLGAIPDLLAFAKTHRLHIVFDILARIAIGALALVTIRRSLPLSRGSAAPLPSRASST
ncbi:MAG: hypothetical protein NVSMB64_21220 [Candidatus Velthaea sp.]